MNMEWQVDLKCRLHYYSGMARLTDQETIAIAKIICYSFQEENHVILCRAHGEALGLLGRQREQGESTSWNIYCGFHWKGRIREGKQAKDSLVWKNVAGCGILGMFISSCLVPGPRRLGQRSSASWSTRARQRWWFGVWTLDWLVCCEKYMPRVCFLLFLPFKKIYLFIYLFILLFKYSCLHFYSTIPSAPSIPISHARTYPVWLSPCVLYTCLLRQHWFITL